MLNTLGNFLQTIEKLIFQLFSWIIFIPKLLILTLVKPDSIPSIIAEELKKDEDKRFDDLISPLLAYAIVIVIPFLYFDQEFKVLAIQGPASIEMGSEAEFFLDITHLNIPEESQVSVEWYVRNNGVCKSEEIREDQRLLPFKTVCSWPKAGKYSVDAYIVFNNNGDSLSEAYSHKVQVVDPELGAQKSETETISENNQVETEAAKNKKLSPTGDPTQLDTLINELNSKKHIVQALIGLAFPLVFSFFLILCSKQELNQENIRQKFYVQCAYFIPPGLSVLGLMATETFFFYRPELHSIAWYSLMLAAFWLFVVEVNYIARLLSIKHRAAMGIILNFFALSLFALALYYTLFDGTHWLNNSLTLYLLAKLLLLMLFIVWSVRGLAKTFNISFAAIARLLPKAWKFMHTCLGEGVYGIPFVMIFCTSMMLILETEDPVDYLNINLIVAFSYIFLSICLVLTHKLFGYLSRRLYEKLRP